MAETLQQLVELFQRQMESQNKQLETQQQQMKDLIDRLGPVPKGQAAWNYRQHPQLCAI